MAFLFEEGDDNPEKIIHRVARLIGSGKKVADCIRIR